MSADDHVEILEIGFFSYAMEGLAGSCEHLLLWLFALRLLAVASNGYCFAKRSS